MQRTILCLSLCVLAACPSAQREPVTNARSANGLAYDLVGRGEPIVLIHGTNLDRRLWDGEMTWLQERARVLRYDLRGHGSSEVPTQPYSNHGDLLALLDELGMSEVSLVGLSAGTQIALDVALAAPDRVERLVLVAPSLTGYVTSVTPPFFMDLREALRAGDHERANEVLLASPLMSVPAEHTDRVRAMVEDNTEFWTIPPARLQQASPRAIERLREVRLPTLVLVGDEDLDAVYAQGQLLAEQMPNARLVTAAGGGHLLNLTSPARFREAVSAFLDLPDD